jgi:hypothetical protein
MGFFDAGEADVQSLVADSKTLVIDPQAVHDGGIDVVDMHGVLDGAVAEIISPRTILDKQARPLDPL